MKKSISILCNLLLSSTLFWAVPSVEADEMISSVAAETTTYCHLRFPAMREDTLSWQQPMLDAPTGNIIVFYGLCNYNQMCLNEIRVKRRVILRVNFEDGD